MITEQGLFLTSFRGGLNDTDPESDLADDQCVVCTNVDLDRAPLGAKVYGSEESDFDASTKLKGVFLSRHLPTNDQTSQVLVAVATSGTTSEWKRRTTSWAALTALDALDVASGQYVIQAKSLHGKWFVAYPTTSGDAVDRLHVWQSDESGFTTTIRRVGIEAPSAAPTASGITSGDVLDTTPRYYRVRFLSVQSGQITRRSEPSASVSFTPDGATHTFVRITRPSLGSQDTFENVTHWEVEASQDQANWHRVSDGSDDDNFSVNGPIPVITTTFDENTALSGTPGATQPAIVGYAQFETSADIGDYTVPYAPKFLAADNDRLLLGGSWFQSDKASRVSWTPVFGDSTGVGNDERLEQDQDPFVDLDGQDGGELTGLTDPVNGVIYAFKYSAVYRGVRTGRRAKAYDFKLITNKRGAIPGSVEPGLDELGRECVYFADAQYGPSRVGLNGVEDCGGDIQTLWRTVNLSASVVCRTLFYPKRKYVTFAFAAGAESFPSVGVRLHIKRCRRTENGVRRGWVKLTTDEVARALTYCLYAKSFTQTNLELRPTWGRQRLDVLEGPQDMIQQSAETGSDEHLLSEDQYQIQVKSKNFLMGQLIRQKGAESAVLVWQDEMSGTRNLILKLHRNFGEETYTKNIGSDPSVTIEVMDDVRLSELRSLQVEMTETDTPLFGTPDPFGLYALSVPLRDEGET